MKFSSLTVFTSAAALVALVGCGGASAPASSAAVTPVSSTPAPTAAKGGDITGVIKFDGAAPAATPIKMAGDAYCAGAGKGQMTDEYAVKDGKIANVFVYLKEGVDLSKVYEQYLATTMIPTFEYSIAGDTLRYRWTNVVKGFDMPLNVTVKWPALSTIKPTEEWQAMRVQVANPAVFRVDENYYVIPKQVP